METLINWKDLTFNSLNEMFKNVADIVPNILGVILIIIVGWLVTKIVLFILKKVLRIAKVDKLTEVINEKDLFGKTDLTFNVSKVILGFVRWIMYLVFLIVAADIMNWTIISVEIGNLLRYLPKLFSAVALFMIGLYIANFVKKAISSLFESFDLVGAKAISALVFYFILILITVTAVNQAGINTDIITGNLTIILGAFLAAIAIGFGFGSKEVIGDLLKTFYTRKNYELGQRIHFDNVDGVIESIDNITMTIKTSKGKMVLPIKDVVASQVEILND